MNKLKKKKNIWKILGKIFEKQEIKPIKLQLTLLMMLICWLIINLMSSNKNLTRKNTKRRKRLESRIRIKGGKRLKRKKRQIKLDRCSIKQNLK